MIKKCIFYILIIVFNFVSCKKETELQLNNSIIDNSNLYFPLEIGKTIKYEITEINIDAASMVYDTIKTILEVKIDSIAFTSTNENRYRIVRKTKNLNNEIIKIQAWQCSIINNQAIATEDNIDFVKLDFPLTINKMWNANRYNNLSLQNYKIENLDISENINNLSFDSVATVIEKSDSSLISKIYIVEKYAKNIGLIYKKDVNVNSQNIIPNVPVEQRITRGKIYEQKILSYE